MDEVYRDLVILALMPPAIWGTLRLMDYGLAKYLYRIGYIEEEPTFSNSPALVRREERKLEEKYRIKK